MEIIKTIANVLWMPIIMFFLMFGIIYFQKERIYRSFPSGWLDIKKYPIPEDIKYFIATDGNTVEYIYGLSWGPYGEVIFDKYKKTYITHWQPLPDLPKN